MSLYQMQKFLFDINRDPAAQKRFLAERTGALSVYDLTAEERDRLVQLGTDLELAWFHPAATTATRKRIVRAVLQEIVVLIKDGHVDLVLHWQGGDHTALKVKKNPSGKHRWTVAEETEELVRELARLMPDRTIAAVLQNARRAARVIAILESTPPARIAACIFAVGLLYRIAVALLESDLTFAGHLVKGAPFSDASNWFRLRKVSSARR